MFLFAAAALGNLYLYLSSGAMYGTQTPLERFVAGGSSSTAELTEFWMRKASRSVLASADKASEAALSVHGLGSRPFDPAGKINVCHCSLYVHLSHRVLMLTLCSLSQAWDIYPPEVSCPDVARVGNVGDGDTTAMSYVIIQAALTVVVSS